MKTQYELKYPIHFEVHVFGTPLCKSFSRQAIGYTERNSCSRTKSLKTAIGQAKKHKGNVVAYWLEDKPSHSNHTGRQMTYGDRIVYSFYDPYGTRKGAGNDHGNSPLEAHLEY